MLKLLFELASRLPLSWLHALGAALGWIAWYASPRRRQRMRANLAQAGYTDAALLRTAIAQSGKSVTELAAVWFRPQAAAAALMRETHMGDTITNARAAGRGIIFVTPHLGCFEVTAQWYTHLFGPMTALFSPPKKTLLAPLVIGGRGKANLTLAAPTLGGIRALLRALQRGEAVGILPDQAPGRGEGEWADFFGRPAYTMTLVDRLASRSGAAVVLAYAERLPQGEGFRGYALPLPARTPGESPARHLNRALEDLIRRCPSQYLWSYNRYKRPAGVAPPDTAAEQSAAPAAQCAVQ